MQIDHFSTLFPPVFLQNLFNLVYGELNSRHRALSKFEPLELQTISFLSPQLDERDQDQTGLQTCSETMDALVKVLRRTLNMALFGVDIIIENVTGIHYVIDINAFPGKWKGVHRQL